MRRALVTGGNRGIGRAIAHGLVDAGLDVVVAARRGDEGAEVARVLGCTSVALDLDDPRSYGPALEAAGPVDVLVNNAGVLWERPPHSSRNQHWTRPVGDLRERAAPP